MLLVGLVATTVACARDVTPRALAESAAPGPPTDADSLLNRLSQAVARRAPQTVARVPTSRQVSSEWHLHDARTVEERLRGYPPPSDPHGRGTIVTTEVLRFRSSFLEQAISLVGGRRDIDKEIITTMEVAFDWKSDFDGRTLELSNVVQTTRVGDVTIDGESAADVYPDVYSRRTLEHRSRSNHLAIRHILHRLHEEDRDVAQRAETEAKRHTLEPGINLDVPGSFSYCHTESIRDEQTVLLVSEDGSKTTLKVQPNTHPKP